MKKLFVELGAWAAGRELTVVRVLRHLRVFHEMFGPRKEGWTKEACGPPLPHSP